jgi:hypothetical protein
MFDKANRWLLRRIEENRTRKRGSLAVDARGLVLARSNEQRRIPWGSIEEIIAARKPAFLGDNLGLWIRCEDRATYQVLEFDPAWDALIDGLSNYLPGSLPYAQWSLRTAFTEPSGQVQVYLRPQRSSPL